MIPKGVDAFIQAARDVGLPRGREGKFLVWLGREAFFGRHDGDWESLAGRIGELVGTFMRREKPPEEPGKESPGDGETAGEEKKEGT